ncbi:hypothetical protein HYPSUDRAFT_85747 [Hypholoma sublateritium FD-334 SS-4]|uniref:Uncharacterized protein n=1 Tax=Hypholoma sublateritium (strain FD-334 SS-4) TaxID=945553 RepID=A0A0D2LCD3_HYPSF|nr:hypothetical protein HYPSUDRAFT_85747 [Hypholoma sublateritium FD-334 SS-4]
MPVINALTHDIPALTAAINVPPTWDTLSILVGEFRTLAEAHPAQTLQLAETIYAVSRPPAACAATVPDEDDPEHPDALTDELQGCMYEMLASAFSANDRAPANAVLVAALMSGAYCAGLQFPGYLHGNSAAESEMYALHACLALLVGGAAMYKGLQHDHGKFASAFKKLVGENVIKDENGKKLLEVTIQQVESGFNRTLDVKEIWATLFPGA